MIRLPWSPYPLTEEQVLDHLMRTLDDDTEDKPWMVMGDLQFWSASSFAHSLRNFARERGLPWYVASMLPILYTWPGVDYKKQLAPDVFVALVPVHPRQSYDVDAEGTFPPFVLEVVSPSSSARDQSEKRLAYEALGAQEYALFTPRADAPSVLDGYRRMGQGAFMPWPPDEHGRLWSDVLDLYLVPRGMLLQAATPDGNLLPTPDQAEEARRREEQARRREAQARREAEAGREAAERERRRAEEAQRQAEDENRRLREEIARLRRQDDDSAGHSR